MQQRNKFGNYSFFKLKSGLDFRLDYIFRLDFGSILNSFVKLNFGAISHFRDIIEHVLELIFATLSSTFLESLSNTF